MTDRVLHPNMACPASHNRTVSSPAFCPDNGPAACVVCRASGRMRCAADRQESAEPLPFPPRITVDKKRSLLPAMRQDDAPRGEPHLLAIPPNSHWLPHLEPL